jgi:hypothetical protein
LKGADTVFLGYPNWWGHLPMPVVSFQEHYDWRGMRIIPFYSNEGSGLSNIGSRAQLFEKKARKWTENSLR